MTKKLPSLKEFIETSIDKTRFRAASIWVIEDAQIMQTYFQMVLGDAGAKIDSFDDVYDARKALGKALPDIIIMDLNLKYGTSLEFCSELRQAYPLMAIIMVSGSNLLENRIKALEAGADLFLCKPINAFEILLYAANALKRKEALTQLRPNQGPQGPQCQLGLLSLQHDKQQAFVGDVNLELRPSEFRLLWCLCESANDIVTREHLARALWNNEKRSSRSLDQYVLRIRKKLENFAPAQGLPTLETIYRQGYRLKI